MDWLSFIASIFGSFAWPLAAIIVAFLFRKALNQLLPGLDRLKYKDLELEFRKDLAEAEKALKPTSQPALPSKSTARMTHNQLYFQKLAEASPRAALLEAWLPFEIAASRIGAELGVSKPGRQIQMNQLIDGLESEGILNNNEANAIIRLRVIRNNVVHSDSINISPTSIVEYTSLLQNVTKSMEQRINVIEAIIKEVIKSGKVNGIPEKMKGEINEDWLKNDMKRRIKESIEELYENKINENGIYEKVIDEIAEMSVKNIKILTQPGSVRTEFNDDDFKILWNEIKTKSKIKKLLSE